MTLAAEDKRFSPTEMVKHIKARQSKLVQSQDRLNEAVKKIFEQNPEFTGQFSLEVHCKYGIIKDIYEIKSRRKV